MPRVMNREALVRLANAPMAMRPDALEALAAQLIARVEFEEPPELQATLFESTEEIDRVIEAKTPRLPKTDGAVAVLPVYGGIAQHRGSEYWGSVFTEEIVGMLSQLIDAKNVGAVVLSFDTPGGIVYGLEESAGSIRDMAQTKPIYGHVKAEAASAGYYLAAQTTKLFAQPSSKVGSIGTWNLHLDHTGSLEQAGVKPTMVRSSKYKAEAAPWLVLTDEARDNMQASVDRYDNQFHEDVAVGRGVSKATVKSDFGQGRMVDPVTAKAAGMIDGIATLHELVAGLINPKDQGRRRSMAARIAVANAWNPKIDA